MQHLTPVHHFIMQVCSLIVTHIIGRYNASARIATFLYHTTSVVCVNFTYDWRDLQFKVDSNRLTSEQFYLLLEFLQEIC